MGALKVQVKQLLSRERWAKFRVLRQYYTLLFYPRHSAQHICGGVPLTVLLADSLAEGWYDCDWPELPDIALLAQRTLKPCARVFDLGAHQAVVSPLRRFTDTRRPSLSLSPGATVLPAHSGRSGLTRGAH
jgi:hypothetical protein